MIGYLCKYTPIELFYGFGETPNLLSPAPSDTQEAAVHPNLCSYAKAVCAGCMDSGTRQIVLVNCCDSIKRIYDILKNQTDFDMMLDLPRVHSPESVRLFAGEFLNFIKKYEDYSGVRFDADAFKNGLLSTGKDEPETRDHLVLLGARMPEKLADTMRSLSSLPIRNLTCTGQARGFGAPPEPGDLKTLLEWYAEKLLGQPPCMRMQDTSGRSAFWADPHTKGIIYHTIKFCDYYGFEYAALKNETDLPVLKIETDYTGAADGQLRTRMEAFFESMDALNTAPIPASKMAKTGRIFAGIDSGSTSTDAVLLNEDLRILATSIFPTGGRSLDGANAALADVLAKSGIAKEDVSGIVATGYGRNAVHMGQPVTEITCHAKGAFFLNPSVRTVIDIGGQDSKIIKLDSHGNILDFSMNDKCAAGTGRFLEMMAGTLGMELSKFALAGLKWEEDIKISSMCSVFAESEVISLIAQNKKKPDIVHGINQSITTRIYAMISRLNCSPGYMMTGGVAKNKGVATELAKRLGKKIMLPDAPQICGALGAALIAARR